VLVTGGAGFLGSHLCDRLAADSVNVICLDNLSTGSYGNISHLIANQRVGFIRGDVSVPIDIQVDEIYNLACVASPFRYQREPVQTLKSSVYGAMNMLNLARQAHATVLQASTSEIYGDPEVHPQPEAYWGRVNPVGPRACYDEGKRCAETLCFDYRRQYQVNIKVARIFNTYGPRMHPLDGRVISNFVCRALMNEPLTIYGSGEQTRSFCYVDDLVEGLIRLMASSAECTGPVNFGNPEEVTVRQLAEQIIGLTGSRSVIRTIAGAVDDPQRRRPAIDIARRQFGWEPKIRLGEGLLKTIEYFDDLYSKSGTGFRLSGGNSRLAAEIGMAAGVSANSERQPVVESA
jgi:UDP-glucuronate decarboxylase